MILWEHSFSKQVFQINFQAEKSRVFIFSLSCQFIENREKEAEDMYFTFIIHDKHFVT